MTVLIVALGEFGLFFVMTIYLQIGRGLTAFQAGLVFLPFAVANFIVAPMAGWLSSRIGPKWVVTSGMLLEAVSIFSTAQLIQPDTAIPTFIPTFFLYGAGVGLTISQLTNTTLSDIPPEKSGVGSGANNTVRQVGAAIGVAILGAVLGQSDLCHGTGGFGDEHHYPSGGQGASCPGLRRRPLRPAATAPARDGADTRRPNGWDDLRRCHQRRSPAGGRDRLHLRAAGRGKLAVDPQSQRACLAGRAMRPRRSSGD